ncbi:2,3-dihydro-2,3-dihydroxybenzoate dehydrogenase [Streptomyces kanamyceticus]|uniref:2,3-dihydro-2,3-dihydroxybenzoate dehydrogenase n=1 Tax=Streptomyces kanamyceticus TaxID=1967 RepID=A0A5J6GII8_STRKN|nr:2,3-dihydro-2,3-dihydroxybenzoate dehydrogenase [Streptomyces kanamyceticus]QEU93745.1 2,3-dihydro-2,3-dihydroxybenzoate dehydrogenase [Streptomyces kanamyceticus]
MPEHIPQEPGEFTGRTALVTGAGQGIGAAVATALAARGAHVVATDRDAHGIDELAAATRGSTAAPGTLATRGAITPRVMDVTDHRAVSTVIGDVIRDHGSLDLLVNVAGILRTAPVAELTDADWADTFAVNTTGVFHTSRAAAAHMTARGSGCIVTVASNAAGIPRTGMAAYAASKAAATMFTKCLGLEIARSGVRCNVVAPGSTDTAMQRSLWTDDEAPRRVIAGDTETYRTGIPLGRIADPQDIADAVLFLASDRARHITLQELYVDGGATLR